MTAAALATPGPVIIDPLGSISVLANVSNTGGRDGAAVVQVYAISRFTRGVLNPVSRLVGFDKVFVAAGATAAVTIAVPQTNLDRWDANAPLPPSWSGGPRGDWVIDAGDFELAVGLCWSSQGLFAAERARFPCEQVKVNVTLVA